MFCFKAFYLYIYIYTYILFLFHPLSGDISKSVWSIPIYSCGGRKTSFDWEYFVCCWVGWGLWGWSFQRWELHGLCLQTRLHSSHLQLKRGSTGSKFTSSGTLCGCGVFQHCYSLGTEVSVRRMDFLLSVEMLTSVTKPSAAGRGERGWFSCYSVFLPHVGRMALAQILPRSPLPQSSPCFPSRRLFCCDNSPNRQLMAELCIKHRAAGNIIAGWLLSKGKNTTTLELRVMGALSFQ